MRANSNRFKTRVLLAAAVIVVLAGFLGARLIARSRVASDPGPLAGKAVVPPALALDISALEVPCWSCPSAKEWPVTFQTDLDILAPLGTGEQNAGLWFKDFAKPDGPRFEEAVAMMARRVDHAGDLGKILLCDDPLLIEAEPWCDQATMHFYPDIFPLEGFSTRIPNLVVALTFARSWIARGLDQEDPQRGIEDCRRAIRLGRLLRQEDVTIISDLVGLACIHIGARGMYDIALRAGDLEMALLASVVIGEVAPQRQMTSERVTRFDFSPYIRKTETGDYRVDMPDGVLEKALDGVDTWTERRFYGEAVLVANFTRFLGTEDQQRVANEFLAGLSASEDPFLVEFAAWAMENEPDEAFMKDVMGLR